MNQVWVALRGMPEIMDGTVSSIDPIFSYKYMSFLLNEALAGFSLA